MAGTSRKSLGLTGIFAGLVLFALGAAGATNGAAQMTGLLGAIAVAGIVLSGVSAAYFTLFSVGRAAVIVGVLSGVVGAVVAWIAMRTMMRLVAVFSGVGPTLTAGGTTAILLTSLMMSLLPAMGYVHFRRRFGGSFPNGLGYGLLLSVVGGVPVLLLELGEIGAIAKVPAVPVTFFLVVPVVFGLTLEASHRFLPRLISVSTTLSPQVAAA